MARLRAGIEAPPLAPFVWSGAVGSQKREIAFDPARKQLYKNTVYFQPALLRPELTMATSAMNLILERIALFQFTPTHCAQARVLLGWSVEALAREADVPADDIRRFEAQQDVTDAVRLALTYRLEAMGLVFFPGFAPGRSASLNAVAPERARRGDFAMAD